MSPDEKQGAILELVERLVERARQHRAPADDCAGRGMNTFDCLVTDVIGGWDVKLSIHTHDDVEHWHLSTILVPRGRSSSDEDWVALGHISSAVVQASGCPNGKAVAADPLTPLSTTHPNAAHHWVWHADGSPLDPAALEDMKALLSAISNEGLSVAMSERALHFSQILRLLVDAEASFGAVTVGGKDVHQNLAHGLSSVDEAIRYSNNAHQLDIAETLETLRRLLQTDLERALPLLRELRLSVRVQLDDATRHDKRPQITGPATFRHRGPKIGRNDPCPCGSGKKYKKCCGRP